MKHHLSALCFLVFSLLLSSCSMEKTKGKAETDMSRESIIVEHDMPYHEITDICEDREGYIWFSTPGGIYKYDGDRFFHFKSTNDSISICNDAVLKVYCAQDSTLYVLTDFGTSVGFGTNSQFHTILKEGKYPSSRDIIESSDGRIFIQVSDFGSYLYEYFPHTRTTVKRAEGEFPILDSKDRVYLWKKGKLLCYDSKLFSLIREYPFEHSIYSVGYLPHNRFAYFTSDGVFVFQSDASQFPHNRKADTVSEQLKNEKVIQTTRFDDESVILFTERKSIYYWNLKTGQLIGQDDPQFPFRVPFNDVTTLLVDSRKNIWLGSKRHGYAVIYHRSSLFNEQSTLFQCFKDEEITHISRTKERIYLITNHQNLFSIDSNHHIEPLQLPAPLRNVNLDQCFVDSRGHLWLVTNQYLYQCNLSTNGTTLQILRSLPYFCYTVGEDGYGNMWWESNHTLYCLKQGAEQPIPVSTNFDLVNVIKPLHDKRIVMGTYAGGVFIVNPLTLQVSSIAIPHARNAGFACRDLVVADSTTVWTVSSGQGVFRIDLKNKDVHTYKDHLLCNQLTSVETDDRGNLWIGSLNGLIRFDPHSGRFFSYAEKDGIRNASYVPMSAVKGFGEELIFGGDQGVTVFNPHEICTGSHCRIKIEYIASNGNILKERSEEVKMSDDGTLREINLSHKNSGVYFYYTTLNFGNISRARTEFLLADFDNDWQTVGEESYAYYSHIPPGTYLLKIRAINEMGNVIDMREVAVHVSAPWWKCAFMLYIAYPLFCIVILAWGWLLWKRFRKNKDEIREAIKQREQEKYANAMNLKYFTNISHEFRTPLTMIYGALKLMGDNKGKLEPKLVQVAEENAGRMLRLVDQLLDFDKLENGALRFAPKPCDAVAVMNKIVERFTIMLQQKQINFSYHVNRDEMRMLLDDDKFDKIVSNLLSNAVKYTPESGTIEVTMTWTDREAMAALFKKELKGNAVQWLCVEVANSGENISVEKQELVFNRFYRIDNSETKHISGTGIGLFYTNQLVQLHGGLIACRDNYPKGVIFYFALPLEETQICDQSKDDRSDVSEMMVNLPPKDKNEEPEEDSIPEEAPVILAIDDDAEILKFLKLMLPDYHLECRTNPKEALQEIERICPDLIISDVLMNEISGYDLCKQLKSNLSTCHLPVILLTAQSLVDHQVQGIEAGADAYVTKPFEPKYLLALIKNILENRNKIRNALAASTEITSKDRKVMQSQDSRFMDQLYTWLEEHLGDPEINLDEILHDFSIGRSKFYYKVKALTGMSPNAFFRTYKLNRAAQMILQGNDKLTYIADVTGFCSQSYFTAQFKKQFGCTPSKYKHS